jgi:hypothetical protein
MSRADREGLVLAGVMLLVMSALAYLARSEAFAMLALAAFGAAFVSAGVRRRRACTCGLRPNDSRAPQQVVQQARERGRPRG